jgi:hypothetical protein
MKPSTLALVVTSLLAFSPFSALAHETQQFIIGDKTYSFVVGSMNEPVVVDDKSGVELTVSFAHDEAVVDETLPHTHEEEESAAVTGLEKTLKVEVIAGDKKKTFDLRAVYGEPGSYSATFIPTVQTTYTYRFFGTINEVPVDLSFTCNPAGHPATPEDTTKTEMGPKVSRTLKKGAFGCPMAKADVGFPEPAPALVDLQTGGHDPLVIVALAAGLTSLALGLWRRTTRP